ncbi:MAG: ribosomal protein S18-alanine N-acetyltransferase [Oscillospiraceae bacterium]|nr:ribosomal protein S18-alanine N-acetyltransferase [Oscillospiraceae bacterium]
MDYTIRDVQPGEIPQIAALEKACFSVPWTADQLKGQLKDRQHEFIAAVSEGGAVLGYIGMMHVLDEGYISNVAVAPEKRRQGIGDALILALLEICAALGLSFVTLEVRAGNVPAIALYEKHGFARVGLRKNYYDRPREDALLMTKTFESRQTF